MGFPLAISGHKLLPVWSRRVYGEVVISWVPGERGRRLRNIETPTRPLRVLHADRTTSPSTSAATEDAFREAAVFKHYDERVDPAPRAGFADVWGSKAPILTLNFLAVGNSSPT